jgi:hypothetical protein
MRCLMTAVLMFCAAALAAREIYVDFTSGKPGALGTRGAPLATADEALKSAAPGDTIFILPSVRPIRVNLSIRDLAGTAERPIVIDGMNNIFSGAAPISSAQWHPVAPGLYKREEVTAWSWVDRYFMTFDGKINRMGRVYKAAGCGADFKKPEELAPGEWTVAQGAEVRRRGSLVWYRFEFYLRLPEGVTPENSGVEEPVSELRNGGIVLKGKCRHLVFRNFIVKNFLNDGYNLHGDCRDILFENIAAVDCGDDGISAHDSCGFTARNLVVIGCSTAICHIGRAVSVQENVYAEKITGREFYFMNDTDTTIRNAYVLAGSRSGSRWTTKKGERQRARLENIFMASENPQARFVRQPLGEQEFGAENVRLAGFREVMKQDGVTEVRPEPLRRLIAEKRTELFALFGGNLEKALRPPKARPTR